VTPCHSGISVKWGCAESACSLAGQSIVSRYKEELPKSTKNVILLENDSEYDKQVVYHYFQINIFICIFIYYNYAYYISYK